MTRASQAATGIEWMEAERASRWPTVRRQLPHAAVAESMLVDHLLAAPVSRVLDLGTGDGHLMDVIRRHSPNSTAIGLDLSPTMVDAARQRFSGDNRVRFETHDLMDPIPAHLGRFDLVVSGLAIHHLPDERKRTLFVEVFESLADGGGFYDLDCVALPTAEIRALSRAAFGFDPCGDPSDQPAALEDQLMWLREAGFEQVDCFWKWMELTLVGGRKAGSPALR